jgi:hypothetical protein
MARHLYHKAQHGDTSASTNASDFQTHKLCMVQLRVPKSLARPSHLHAIWQTAWPVDAFSPDPGCARSCPFLSSTLALLQHLSLFSPDLSMSHAVRDAVTAMASSIVEVLPLWDPASSIPTLIGSLLSLVATAIVILLWIFAGGKKKRDFRYALILNLTIAGMVDCNPMCP